MSDIEKSVCDICGNVKEVNRKYYEYSIPCDCCNRKEDYHFEIVRYCSECTPKPPGRISVVLQPVSQHFNYIHPCTIKM